MISVEQERQTYTEKLGMKEKKWQKRTWKRKSEPKLNDIENDNGLDEKKTRQPVETNLHWMFSTAYRAHTLQVVNQTIKNVSLVAYLESIYLVCICNW